MYWGGEVNVAYHIICTCGFYRQCCLPLREDLDGYVPEAHNNTHEEQQARQAQQAQQAGWSVEALFRLCKKRAPATMRQGRLGGGPAS